MLKSIFLSRVTVPSVIESSYFAGADFSFYREGWLHQQCKNTMQANEIQTRSAAFNRAVYIACDDQRLRTGLSSEKARQAILTLFDLGAPVIHCKKGRLFIPVARDKYGKVSADEAHNISLWSSTLDELAQALLEAEPQLRQYRPEPFSKRIKNLQFLAFLLSFIGVTAGLFIGFDLWNTDTWMISGWPWFCIFMSFIFSALLTSFVVWSQLTASTRLPSILMGGFIWMGLLGGTVIPLALVRLNQSTHDSPVVAFESSVHSIQVKTKNSYRTDYVFEPPPSTALHKALIPSHQVQWPNHIHASSTLNHKLQVCSQQNRPVQILIQQGRLGWPLIHSIKTCHDTETFD